MAKNEVKYGAIFSYILIILNATYGLFLMPYILAQVGTEDYGVYKTMSSFTAALMILDIGIASTMMRYISKFRTYGQEKKIPNYIANLKQVPS